MVKITWPWSWQMKLIPVKKYPSLSARWTYTYSGDVLCKDSSAVMWEICLSLPLCMWLRYTSASPRCSHDENSECSVGVSERYDEMFTEQSDLLSDAVDIYDGPQRTADAEPTVEEDWLSIIDAVENSPMAIGPERQHIVLQSQSLRQGFGPVARSCHQVWASVLGDVGSDQFARV